MDTQQEKICTACLLSKPLDAFRNDKYRPNGKSSKCRECKKKRDKELHALNPEPRRQATANWRAANPDKVQDYQEAYKPRKKALRKVRYEANREAVLAQNAAWYEANKEKRKLTMATWEKNNRPKRNEQSRMRRLNNPEQAHARDRRADEKRRAEKAVYNALYYEENREQELARVRTYHANNRDKELEYQRNYYLANKLAIQAYLVTYRAEHPEVHRSNHKRYKARKNGAAIVDLTPEQFEELKAERNYRCAYCPDDCIECKNKTHDLHQDHVQPLSKNGNHTVQNVVPCCQSHNSQKGNGPVLKAVQLSLLTEAPPRPRKPRTKKGS